MSKDINEFRSNLIKKFDQKMYPFNPFTYM